MFFIIQEDAIVTDQVQNAIILDVLRRNKYAHSYELMSSLDFYKQNDDEDIFSMTSVLKSPDDFDERYRNAIPFGSVRFIEQYLQIFKGIPRDNAIEVPPALRTDEFLKRKYSIVRRDDIPRKGNYFIKDATQQKLFSYKTRVHLDEEKTNEKDDTTIPRQFYELPGD